MKKYPHNDIEPRLTESPVKASMRQKPSSFASHVRDIATELYEDVLLPSVRDLISDFLMDGMSRLLFGDRRRGGHHRRERFDTHTNYTRSRNSHQNRHSMQNVNDICFETRRDAELILNRMNNTIRQYGVVTVGDLYSYIGQSADHLSERYQWVSLHGVRSKKTSYGWVLTLPEPTFSQHR